MKFTGPAQAQAGPAAEEAAPLNTSSYDVNPFDGVRASASSADSSFDLNPFETEIEFFELSPRSPSLARSLPRGVDPGPPADTAAAAPPPAAAAAADGSLSSSDPTEPSSTECSFLSVAPCAVSVAGVGVDPHLDSGDSQFLQRSVYCLSASMLFNFMSFGPSQNLMPLAFPGDSSVSLILIYTFFALSSITAPMVVRYCHPANALVVASIGYLSFAIGCATGWVPLLFLSSILCGFSASLIWTASGACLTQLSTKENRGRNSAIMVGCIRACQVISNLLVGYLVNANFSWAVVYFLLLLIGCLGFVGFVALRIRWRRVTRILDKRDAWKKAMADQHHAASSPAASAGILIATSPSVRARFLEIFRLMRHPNIRHLIPVMVFLQGMGNGFYFGSFGVTMGAAFIGYAHAVMGCVAVATIVLLGGALDRIPLAQTYRKKYTIYVTGSAHICLFFLAAITSSLSDGFTSRSPESSLPRRIDFPTFAVLAYLTSICFGMAWSGTDISQYYFLGQSFSTSSEVAFSVKVFFESIGFVSSEVLLSFVPPKVYPVIAACWCLPVLWWYSRWKFPTELMRSKSIAPADEGEEPTAEPDWHA